MKAFVFILARKNSIRLKKKNHLKIKNISLVERTIRFAYSLKYVNKIILSSDDTFQFSKSYEPKLIIVKRPKSLSGPKSRPEDAILHAIIKLKLELKSKNFPIILLQPTSPFRSKVLIFKAYKKILNNLNSNYSIISVSKSLRKNTTRLFLDSKGKLVKQKSFKNKNSISCTPNGNFYLANLNFIKKNRSFFKEKNSIPFFINSNKLKIDINTKKDFLLAKSFELR